MKSEKRKAKSRNEPGRRVSPTKGTRARLVVASGAAVLCLALAGCRVGGGQSASDANDELRKKIIDQDKRIVGLEGERDELKVKLAEAQRVREGALPADVLDALPRCTKIEIGTLSGYEPRDPKAPARSVLAYIVPRDGRGRFVQVVGTMKVVALILPATLEQSAAASPEQHVLATAERTLTPGEVRDAYRSGITGTHYEIDVPLREPISDRSARVLIRAEFLDALTGQVQKAEWMKPLK